MNARLGCIADDYTGATDLASMVSRTGLKVIQLFGVVEDDLLALDAYRVAMREADAMVIALKSRSSPACEAVADSLRSLEFLQKHGFDRYFFKYCSTFDSTAEGNIGPVADALADRLGCDRVIFCPAFPENDRTVYQGHLFVGDQLLSESSLRNHPLNPMTDSCLVRWLQAQSKRSVGRLERAAEPPGNAQYLIADAIDNDDLRRIAKLARNDRLLTGGSAIAMYWALELYGKCTRDFEDRSFCEQHGMRKAGRAVVLAGSCSAATTRQVATFGECFPVLQLPLDESDAEVEAQRAWLWCQQQWASSKEDSPLLVASGSNAQHVAAVRRRLGESEAASFVESIFAKLADRLAKAGLQNLIIAGGETSGAVVKQLGIRGVRIGEEIAPGVPRVYPIDRPEMSLVLKSGNFGSERFFLDATANDP